MCGPSAHGRRDILRKIEFYNHNNLLEVWKIEELGRYRLALALIADPDEADRLFMEARSTKELQRLIERWRDRNGLGPASLDVELPVLSSDQIEHAHHLAKRARTRRLVKRWLAVAVGASALLLTVLWVVRPPAAARLVADPNFRFKPIMTLPEVDGHALQIYQVESTTGSVTIWWGITGDGADQLEPNLRPKLTRRLPSIELLSPVENSTGVVSPARLVGRSHFRLATVGRGNLSFTVLEDYASGRIRFTASIPAPIPLPDPEAHLINLDESIGGTSGTYIIKEVIKAPDYTIIQVGGSLGFNPHLSLETDRGILPFWGSFRSEEERVTSFLFGPLPSDVRHFVLQQTKQWHPAEILLFADGRLWLYTTGATQWRVVDQGLEVEVEIQADFVLDRTASVRDTGGRSYPVTISTSFTPIDRGRRWRIVAGPLPSDLEVELLTVGVSGLVGEPEWSASVQLPATTSRSPLRAPR